MSNYVNKVIKDEVTHSIYDARILELPDEQIGDIQLNTKYNSLYIDTTKIPNWEMFNYDNAAGGEVEGQFTECYYSTTQGEAAYWKDGGTFKYYNPVTESWIDTAAETINATLYLVSFEKDKGVDGSSYYEEEELGDVIKNGSNVSYTSQSSEPDPSSAEIWYNENNNKLYKSDGSSWTEMDASEYRIINSSGYFYFSDSEKLMYYGMDQMFYFAYGDNDASVIMGAAMDATVGMEMPYIGVLKYLSIYGIDSQAGEGVLIVNKDFPYGPGGGSMAGNTWFVSGVQALQSPAEYLYMSENFNLILNDSVKSAIRPVENGQYYKDKDKAESRELLENGMMISTLTFPTYNKGEGKVDFSSLLDNVTPDATFTASLEGMDASVKQYTLFSISAGGESMTMQVVSMYINGEPEPGYTIEGTQTFVFMFPVEINSAEVFEEYGEEMTRYSFFLEMDAMVGGEHQYDSQWGGSEMDEPDENGTFQIGATVSVSDLASAAKPFIDENMLAEYSPASIGDLLRCVDGELEPLLTSSNMPQPIKLTAWLSSSDFYSSTSGPFKYRGSKYLYKNDKEGYTYNFDENKDYVFELINNDPTAFATSGLVLDRASFEQNAERIRLEFRCIDKDQLPNYVYIKVTEGEI